MAQRRPALQEQAEPLASVTQKRKAGPFSALQRAEDRIESGEEASAV
jgi:hypothetical protein